jgi:hypothetical protein
MKGYLLTSGTIFALVGAMHLAALVQRWRLLTSDFGFVVENGLLCAVSLSLAFWAFRLIRAPKVGAA